METLRVSPTGVGNVGDFQKTFFGVFIRGMSQIASMLIVHDIQMILPDSNRFYGMAGDAKAQEPYLTQQNVTYGS